MTKSTQIIFFGNDDFSSVVLRRLLDSGFDVLRVITSPLKRSGRGRQLTAHPVIDIANEHKIPYKTPASLKNLDINYINHERIDTAVLASYGKIIPQEILDMFKIGIINVHPSLLPRWRGPSPIESTILSGDNVTGVSLMKLSKAMDEGPIYLTKKLALSGNESQIDLYNILAGAGSLLLSSNLMGIISGNISAKPQPSEGATYSKIISKSDGNIDWNDSATDIERQIRAFNSWPQSRGVMAGKEVIITQATVSDSPTEQFKPGKIVTDSSNLLIACGQDVLLVEKLKPVGKREMSGSEFIRGYLR